MDSVANFVLHALKKNVVSEAFANNISTTMPFYIYNTFTRTRHDTLQGQAGPEFTNNFTNVVTYDVLVALRKSLYFAQYLRKR